MTKKSKKTKKKYKKLADGVKLRALGARLDDGSGVPRGPEPTVGLRVSFRADNPFLFSCAACGEWAAWLGLWRVAGSNYPHSATPILAALKRLPPGGLNAALVAAGEYPPLEFHHLLPRSQFPNFEEAAGNIIPICKKCHNKISVAGYNFIRACRGGRSRGGRGGRAR